MRARSFCLPGGRNFYISQTAWHTVCSRKKTHSNHYTLLHWRRKSIKIRCGWILKSSGDFIQRGGHCLGQMVRLWRLRIQKAPLAGFREYFYYCLLCAIEREWARGNKRSNRFTTDFMFFRLGLLIILKNPHFVNFYKDCLSIFTCF